MSKKDLQQVLLVGIGEKLSAFGFEKKARQQSFSKVFEGGKAYVHLSFINHVDDFDTTVDVAIRFDSVEILLNSKNILLTKKEKEGTCTLGIELGNLSIGEQKRWNIEFKEQIPTVVNSIIECFETFGYPYLSKYSSLESAYDLLSSDDSSVWNHCPFHATRAKSAIVIATLLGHKDIQEQILKRKKFLEEIKDFGLSDFLSFTNEFC